jgi:hypothetical protein
VIWLHLLEWVAEVCGTVGGGAGVGGDLADLLGMAGIAAGVLVGDPGEPFGLAGEELGQLGDVVVASGAATGFGEVMEELAMSQAVTAGRRGRGRRSRSGGSWRGPVPICGYLGLGAFAAQAVELLRRWAGL